VKKEFTDAPLFPDVLNSALEIYNKPEVVKPSPRETQTIRAEIKMLPVDQIEFRKKFRSTENVSDFDAFSGSVKTHGMFEPIVVRATGDGLYTVVRGNRRLAALQQIGHRQIEARVLQGGSELTDLYELIGDEHHRQQFSALDKAEIVLEIVVLESGATEAIVRGAINRHSNVGRNLKEILEDQPILEALQRAVQKIGIRVDTYRTEYLPLIDLEADLKSALQQGISKSLVLEIKRVDNVSQRQTLIEEISTGQKKFSVRTLRAKIDEEQKTQILTSGVEDQNEPEQNLSVLPNMPVVESDALTSESGVSRALLLAPIAAVIDALIQLEPPSENNQRAADMIRDVLKILRTALENRAEFDWAYAHMSMDKSHE
jgi:ParB/RepB/Spo0J family partition protein